MIHGIGVDIVDIERIHALLHKYKKRFIERILHKVEKDYYLFKGYVENPTSKDAVRFVASRFAIKEATVKALGTGFIKGISFADIACMHNDIGKPELILCGIAEKISQEYGIFSSHISLSHEKKYAVAVVILEK